ncbi:rg, partial [Symbiodinium microadriaticum]
MLTRPKKSRLNSACNWEDSDFSEEDAEETSINVTSRSEPKSFALFSTHQEEKRPLWTMQFQWMPDERQVFSADVNEIMLEQALNGSLLLTNKYLYFHPRKRIGGFAVQPDAFRNRRWKLDRLTECYSRRYLLQNCGIEMFFADCPEVFLAFNSTQEVIRFFKILRKQHVPSLMTGSSLSPTHIFQHSNWTELWRRRMISNFEYVMRLNIMAGRSFNDITQYPVMPWILADYTSDEIDLNDPGVYRDLTKPVGALNPERLEEILDRYKSFGDASDMPSFMYGSHYSSSGIVMHFLIRQEPFTSMAITLQGGRFDCPDRLFFNMKETWRCCNTSMSDVKELIPECFYLPEMFINTNQLPLGELQDDRGMVDDVILPRWCKGNPFEFVRIHSEAMESDYASEHLHIWIDLVFGQKQVGQAAVDACNLFHYLTYENAIDIESIEDPLQRNAMKAQVTHFGQTPSQLLSNKEHP